MFPWPQRVTQAGPHWTFLTSVCGKCAFLSGAGLLRCKPRAAWGQGSSFKGQPGENEAALLKGSRKKERKSSESVHIPCSRHPQGQRFEPVCTPLLRVRELTLAFCHSRPRNAEQHRIQTWLYTNLRPVLLIACYSVSVLQIKLCSTLGG